MEAREKKGLLSEADKALLVQLRDEAKHDKECVIM